MSRYIVRVFDDDKSVYEAARAVEPRGPGSTGPASRNEDDMKGTAVDVYFAPKAPAGKEKNWVPTHPDKGLQVIQHPGLVGCAC